MSRMALQSIAAAAVLTLEALTSTPAIAQMPPDIADKIAAIGRVSDPAKTGPIYAPLHEKEPYAGAKVLRDLKYGPHERNTLDLFVAEAAGGARPVFMFVHGGGFIPGTNRPPASPFSDNGRRWPAGTGRAAVTWENRLRPQFRWPTGAEDLGMAVRWVADNIAAHGGDPNRVFLMGHSAGATHVATYVAHPQFHGPRASGLAGAMFSSGAYDLTKLEEGEGRNAYF